MSGGALFRITTYDEQVTLLALLSLARAEAALHVYIQGEINSDKAYCGLNILTILTNS